MPCAAVLSPRHVRRALQRLYKGSSLAAIRSANALELKQELRQEYDKLTSLSAEELTKHFNVCCSAAVEALRQMRAEEGKLSVVLAAFMDNESLQGLIDHHTEVLPPASVLVAVTNHCTVHALTQDSGDRT